jgi:hypothetical protein
MKKKVMFILLILVGVLTLKNTKDKKHQFVYVAEIVESIEFDTNFNDEDFNYVLTASKKHSDAIGILDWVGEV